MLEIIKTVIMAILYVVGCWLAISAIKNIADTIMYSKKNKMKFKYALKYVIWSPKLLEFIKWMIIDIVRIAKHGKKFSEFGLTLVCGRQGEGKTIFIIDYLERMRKQYPKAKIVTNFSYENQHHRMNTWQDLIDIRNGEDGVIFAIDEIQNEYDSNSWADFPEELLREVTQQRKQRVKIIASSQVYGRVVKQLREQCFDVVECWTIGRRWTFAKAFDAWEYEKVLENPDKKMKLKMKWKRSFVQTDNLRNLYDTYEKVLQMREKKKLPRNVRMMG